MKNITDEFIEYLWSICPDKINEETYHQAKRCFVDYIGVTFAGAAIIKDKVQYFLEKTKTNVGNNHIIGLGKSIATTSVAALLNGISAHVMELDDGHRAAMVHSGAPIISALLADAYNETISWKDFLYGIIIGYEAAILLGIAIQPAHRFKGYHVTGTCGTVGAAMAIAAARKYSKSEYKSALSAAVTGAAGILEMIENESNLKPYNAGRAAMDGLIAAYIAKSGFRGPKDVIGGDRGFLFVMGNENSNLQIHKKGQLEIERIYQKKYASCRYCHAPIEAVLKILEKNKIVLENIRNINVETFSLAVQGHSHKEISNISSAKMSIPYSVAVALADGESNIKQYSERRIRDKEIQKLIRKVEVTENKALTELVPDKRGAIVKIILNDDEHFVCKIDNPKGEPENPLSDDEIKKKARELLCFAGLNSSIADDIIDNAWNIENSFYRVLKLL